MHGHTPVPFLFAKKSEKLYTMLTMSSEKPTQNPLKDAYGVFLDSMKELEKEQDALIRDARTTHDAKQVEKVRRIIKSPKS